MIICAKDFFIYFGILCWTLYKCFIYQRSFSVVTTWQPTGIWGQYWGIFIKWKLPLKFLIISEQTRTLNVFGDVLMNDNFHILPEISAKIKVKTKRSTILSEKPRNWVSDYLVKQNPRLNSEYIGHIPNILNLLKDMPTSIQVLVYHVSSCTLTNFLININNRSHI